MVLPAASDYMAAIQHPEGCFQDPELRQGRAVPGPLGLPLVWSGSFATVFQFRCPKEQTWAVKCFTRPIPDLQERYQAISEHLLGQRLPFMVEFRYLEEGIRVRGAWHPVVKMRWVEGFTLNEFLRDHAGSVSLLEQLCGLWLRMAEQLRATDVAHGDLHPGNVLLVPGSKTNAMALRLIDYDGMWVPALAGRPPDEVGHPDFQHPQRQERGGYDPQIDYFAHLVSYTALRGLLAGGPGLWQRHDNERNLLFSEQDFRDPGDSLLFRTLLGLPDEQVRGLAARLVMACRAPLSEVPFLPDFAVNGSVTALSAGEEVQVRGVIDLGEPDVPTTIVAPPVPQQQRVTTRTAPLEPPRRKRRPRLLPGEVTNSIGMRLALIPAGRFTMGAPKDEVDRSADEGPQHEVEISRPFYLGAFPVTQEEYEAVVGINPSWFRADGGGKARVKGMDTRRFPVEQVSWDNAVAFCRKLSDRPAERAAGHVYRLPTEAEWEYACRGGVSTSRPFSFGASLSSTQANFDGNFPYGGGPKGPNLERTCEVGSYWANGFELHDLHGNVWEWCSDWYDKDYYAASRRKDPAGPVLGTGRVFRGGCWDDFGQFCRSASRGLSKPGDRDGRLGFRVALVPSGQ
jgi:formylglycine-generating enzyme required for sulfatase activity